MWEQRFQPQAWDPQISALNCIALKKYRFVVEMWQCRSIQPRSLHHKLTMMHEKALCVD